MNGPMSSLSNPPLRHGAPPMKTSEATVKHVRGLHARPAARLVRLIREFRAEVWIRNQSLQVNGRSILGILMLAATLNTQLTIEAQGDEEEEAVRAVQSFLEEAQDPDDDRGGPS